MINNDRPPLSLPWAITFADMALLLLCFFVMLATLRGTQTKATEQTDIRQTATPTLNNRPGKSELAPTDPARQIGAALSQRFSTDIAEGWLNVTVNGPALQIRFGTADGFDSGSDTLTPRTLRLIDAIGELVTDSETRIVVVGHTDDEPIRTGRFRDNWDLSSARAVSVIRELIGRHGIDPVRLEAKGYADTRPRAPNDSEWNRALNRRIEVEIVWPR